MAVRSKSWQNANVSSALHTVQLNTYAWWDGAVQVETSSERELTEQDAQTRLAQAWQIFFLGGVFVLPPASSTVHRSTYQYDNTAARLA